MDTSSLPKVELHCHQDLIVHPSLLRELHQHGYSPLVAPEAFEAVLPVVDFEGFVRYGQIRKPIDGDLDNLRPIVGLHVQRLAAQNVTYTELGVGASEIPSDRDEMLAKVGGYRAYLNQLAVGRTHVELLVTFGRSYTPEKAEDLADRTIALHAAGLVAGVTVCGREKGFPIAPLHRALARLHEAGVGIEVHAGEWAGPESVWEALELGFPDRIGHGVAIFEDPSLISLFRERQIHVEMCLTSNVKTGAVRRLEDHPLPRAIEAGLNVGLNTDDPGPFECSMNSEFDLAVRLFGLTEADLRALTTNAWNARFARDSLH